MVASDKGNQRRAALLGMPFGTAASKLRKSIIMHLAQQLEQDICFKCKRRIETLEEWSIEHKDSWQRADDPVQAFWDLDNIAFSHIGCNKPETGHPAHNRKIAPEGTAWCSYGKHFVDTDKFHKDASRWNGVHKDCNPCFYKARREYPSRKSVGM
jgi:hypothetical protein